LHARAETVVEKTRNLITLEAEDAFLRWQAAYDRAQQSAKSAKRADDLAKNSKSAFLEVPNRPNGVRDWLEAVVLAGQVKASLNEALHQQALGVAALERITAGGLHAVPAQP
jgi:hypothetical protein